MDLMKRKSIGMVAMGAVAAATTWALFGARPVSGNPPTCVDADGDGHGAIPCGDDCDDNDAQRYPGNTEVCDDREHDEDCDNSTYGHRDTDGDGEDDARCCNKSDGALGASTCSGLRCCGTDADDTNPFYRFGVQACDGPDRVVFFTKGNDGYPWIPQACPPGTKCVAQPNNSGVCMTAPPGYVAPPPFKAPSKPVPLPTLGKALQSIGRRAPVLTPAHPIPPVR